MTFNSTSDYKQLNEVNEGTYNFSDESDNLYHQRGQRGGFFDKLNNYYKEAKKIKCKTSRRFGEKQTE
eukprot:CAMPEP_0170530384 /NCGR_PEP_ID=MMETSP0209-20121228/46671_1 /TAXON_ID=665100 ORGANISM="Litonotus pictus, Strain P1" /NCGR_SAMPLE_ID=MMETSP0209 /ASSEMBLY_ACC=CAM_ASM_000301 /LENGTH=67 /DNA_ID=CAMNT_0010823449 /DNA_START=409 /DNA_END=609 /DNA_ORIENTATION=+